MKTDDSYMEGDAITIKTLLLIHSKRLKFSQRIACKLVSFDKLFMKRN